MANKQNELSDIQKQAIQTYIDEIKTLEDYVTAVRKVPGMYIGPIGNLGYLNMIREIFQNSIDQVVDPTSPANYISVCYNMQTLEVTVIDTGKGLPFDAMVRILTTPHTSKNYEKKKGQYSSGRHGQGAKVVNALSTSFIAESYRYDGKAVRLEMVEGFPTTKEPTPIPNKDHLQGTKISFFPCTEILGHLDLDWNIVYRLVKRITSLTPIGSIVDFIAVDLNGNKHEEHIVNTDGIITDLIMKASSPIIKPIVCGYDNGEQKIDIAFVYDASVLETGDNDTRITAFCNYCPTSSGTHISGTVKGIESWFVSYMNKIYLNAKNNKTKVISADVDCGLCIMISAASLEPIFTGQAKEILSNTEMEPFAKEVVMRALDEWSKTNPQDLNKLCKYIKDIADIRMKADKEKVKIVDKFEKTFTGYPKKYFKPEGKEHLELIICEGDSAAGTIIDGRCKKRQGVMPIRGKMPNAFRTKREKFLMNEEVQGISKIILDAPYTKNFDVNKIKWEKIIFGADADIDGGHICALLIRFFLLYFPQLIEAGKVYKAIPPLFGTKVGKKNTYYTERIDIVRYIQKQFAMTNTVATTSGTILNSKELSVLFSKNIDYLYEVDKVASTYAIDPCMLEIILINHINKTSPACLRKDIKKSYRFVDVEKNKKYGIDCIEGAVNGKSYDTVYVTDQLITECKNIIDILLLNDDVSYRLNGNVVPLYTLMDIFEKSNPSNIQRFKGLGEMNYDQLAESTIHPDGNRVLQQYTLEDAKEEIAAIREYESNMKLILKEVGTVSRTELLG